MREKLINAYHRLPPVARNWVASARGYRLRNWRYGPDTDAMKGEAVERETWTLGQWQEWQKPRLTRLLLDAGTKVPHYRKLWQGTPADRSSAGVGRLGKLENWPVLRKKDLRSAPESFLNETCSISKLREEHTSGTSGTPLKLWLSQETSRAWYALMEARWRGWYGLSRADRWAILGGQLVASTAQKKPPFWVWNSGLKQLYLSSYHLSADTCAAYFEAIAHHRILYLWGYASSLYSLALFAQEKGIAAPPLKLAISNAEPLYAHQRELISRVLNCPVHDTYGMSEMVCAASECEKGALHLWPEVGIYEVLRDQDDQPVEPGQTGRLVCTGLLNPDMPLIRYEVGDRVAIAPEGTQCGCGRSLPILLSVEGRCDDVILTPDGRRVGRLDPVFKSDIPIREAQIVQESLALVRMLVVPGDGFSAEHEEALSAALRERVGPMEIHLEKVASIPRSANGKFRAVISRVRQPVLTEKTPGVLTNATL
jgi:phenylacetate-CoA ligase